MTHETVVSYWLAGLSTDVSRYVIFAVGFWALLWVVLAGPLKGRKIRAETPPAKQLLLEVLFSVRSVVVFSTVGVSTFLLDKAGLLPGPALAASWGPVWFFMALALMIIGHDAWFYWTHRLIHDPRLFRRLHRRHHKSHNPSPFTAYSFDMGEAAINAAFVPLWMLIVPTPWPVVGLFMLHQIVRNTMGHSGYELFPAAANGKPLFDWLTTVTHHDLHHAQAGYNYGLYFTFWDRVMGTEHPAYHAHFAKSVRKEGRTGAPVHVGIAVCLALLALSPQPAAAGPWEDIQGDWATPGLGVVVRIAPCAGQERAMCGRLLWSWDPSRTPHVAQGGVMIEGLRYTDGAWREGLLINPEDGRSYSGRIEQTERDILRLTGCAAAVFCQSQTWWRLSSIPRP
jgi:Delta7-sterol 5-desaturase